MLHNVQGNGPSGGAAGLLPIARGEKAPDRIKHDLMMERLRDCRPILAYVTGLFHGTRDRAREDYLDVRIILTDPGSQHETSAFRRTAIRQHKGDIVRRAKQRARLGCVDRFQHAIPAFAQIFRKGTAHDDVTLNKQDTLLLRCMRLG